MNQKVKSTNFFPSLLLLFGMRESKKSMEKSAFNFFNKKKRWTSKQWNYDRINHKQNKRRFVEFLAGMLICVFLQCNAVRFHFKSHESLFLSEIESLLLYNMHDMLLLNEIIFRSAFIIHTDQRLIRTTKGPILLCNETGFKGCAHYIKLVSKIFIQQIKSIGFCGESGIGWRVCNGHWIGIETGWWWFGCNLCSNNKCDNEYEGNLIKSHLIQN